MSAGRHSLRTEILPESLSPDSSSKSSKRIYCFDIRETHTFIDTVNWCHMGVLPISTGVGRAQAFWDPSWHREWLSDVPPLLSYACLLSFSNYFKASCLPAQSSTVTSQSLFLAIHIAHTFKDLLAHIAAGSWHDSPWLKHFK